MENGRRETARVVPLCMRLLATLEMRQIEKEGIGPSTRAFGARSGHSPCKGHGCHERAAQRRVEWCERGDSNPHVLANASPSSWCVCQFRHFRDEGRPAKAGLYLSKTRPANPASTCRRPGRLKPASTLAAAVAAAPPDCRLPGSTNPGRAGRGSRARSRRS